MKKTLLIFLLTISVWMGYTKWVNQDFPYPWEYFKSTTNVEETLAWKSYSTCWDNFRLNFPYHIQSIGVSDYQEDGSRIIIVSEPPKHFQKMKLKIFLSTLKQRLKSKPNL